MGSFRSDQRGAILLVGLFMGGVLACALWYLLAVGQAVVHQERLQMAADAVAYQTAIWHARGMNIVALINMLMAVALTVIVAFRVVELVMAVIIIACMVATSWTGVGPVACDAVGMAELTEVVTMENETAYYMFKGFKIAGYVQEAVAIAMPYLATGPGLEKTTEFYRGRGIPDHNAYSLSLLPSSLDIALSALGKPIEPRMSMAFAAVGSGAAAIDGVVEAFQQGSAKPLAKAVTQGFPSLPIEEDDFKQLCSRTGEVIASSAMSMSLPSMAVDMVGPKFLPDKVIKAFDATDQLVRTAAGDLMGFGAVSVILCEPLMSMLNRILGRIVPLGLFKLNKYYRKIEKKFGGGDGKKSWLDKIEGTKEEEGAVDKWVNGKLGKTGGDKIKGIVKGIASTNADKVHPAALWNIAQNGNIFLRTWASVGNQAQSRWAFAKDPTPQPGQAVASAEYYASCYDFTGDLPSFLKNTAVTSTLVRNCSDDAMWRIGWSARMRRVRPMKSDLGMKALAQNVIQGELEKVLPFGDTIMGKTFLNYLLGDDNSVLNDENGLLHGPISKAADAIDGWFVTKWAQERVNQALGTEHTGRIIH